jgi:hypothetical protein
MEPTSGTEPQATGAVKRAARYATRPRTTGRCGCVEGKRCRVTLGERRVCGSGWDRMFGRRGERIRRVLPRASVRSDGLVWSLLLFEPDVGGSGTPWFVGVEGEEPGADEVNHSSWSGSGRTWASDRRDIAGSWVAAVVGFGRHVLWTRAGCMGVAVEANQEDESAGTLRIEPRVIGAVVSWSSRVGRYKFHRMRARRNNQRMCSASQLY